MSHAYRWIAVCAAIMAFMVVGAFGQAKPGLKTVSAQELQSGTAIVGLLGFPLGEVVSVSGKIVESDTKRGGQLLELIEIDGKDLPGIVQMRYSVCEWGNISSTPLPANRLLRLRVYETGGMVGIPIEAMKETAFVQTEGWGFSTSLVLLNRE